MFGGNYVQGLEEASESLPVKLTSPAAIDVFCYEGVGDTGSFLFSAGMTATRVASDVAGTVPSIERRAQATKRNPTRSHSS